MDRDAEEARHACEAKRQHRFLLEPRPRSDLDSKAPLAAGQAHRGLDSWEHILKLSSGKPGTFFERSITSRQPFLKGGDMERHLFCGNERSRHLCIRAICLASIVFLVAGPVVA